MTPFRDPFDLFMGAHDEIREALDVLQRLSTRTPGEPASAQDRAAAQDLVGFLEQGILPHHREEERELWPLVARADATADEHAAFVGLARRLQAEHEELEARWSAVGRSLRELAAGRTAGIDAAALAELAQRYREHAALEEDVLVPLARHLLAPDEQGRLAISLLLSRLPAGKWGMV